MIKPVRSRSMAFRKERMNESTRLPIAGPLICILREKLIKCLGKWYKVSRTDKGIIFKMMTQSEKWVEQVDTSGLPGKFEVSCYHDGVLPSVSWKLLVFDIPASTVDQVERENSIFLRGWLKVPRSFGCMGLYSQNSKLSMPNKSISEVWNVIKVCSVTARVIKSATRRDQSSGCAWDKSCIIQQAASMVSMDTVWREGVHQRKFDFERHLKDGVLLSIPLS